MPAYFCILLDLINTELRCTEPWILKKKKLCWLHWNNISCEYLPLFFVSLRCVVPVSKYYRLCLVTVRTKVLQNGRLVRFSKTTDCWCMFSWSVSNRNSPVRCIQSSSIQGYDGISCSLINQVPHAYSKAGNAKMLHIFSLVCYWTC